MGAYKERKPSFSLRQAAAVARRLGEGESASALVREFSVRGAIVDHIRLRAEQVTAQ